MGRLLKLGAIFFQHDNIYKHSLHACLSATRLECTSASNIHDRKNQMRENIHAAYSTGSLELKMSAIGTSAVLVPAEEAVFGVISTHIHPAVSIFSQHFSVRIL